MRHDDSDHPESRATGDGAADHRPAPERDDEMQRPFDELPARPWRGPLTFGIVAATLQMGGLLWLAKCR